MESKQFLHKNAIFSLKARTLHTAAQNEKHNVQNRRECPNVTIVGLPFPLQFERRQIIMLQPCLEKIGATHTYNFAAPYYEQSKRKKIIAYTNGREAMQEHAFKRGFQISSTTSS